MFVSFGWRTALCLVFINSFQMSQDPSVVDEKENRETQVAWSQASLLLFLPLCCTVVTLSRLLYVIGYSK